MFTSTKYMQLCSTCNSNLSVMTTTKCTIFFLRSNRQFLTKCESAEFYDTKYFGNISGRMSALHGKPKNKYFLSSFHSKAMT